MVIQVQHEVALAGKQSCASRGTNEKVHRDCDGLFGLPDRIRTCDLKSRSLARYPAVPRVDMTADH